MAAAKKILVIEDDTSLAQAFEKVIQKRGFTAFIETNPDKIKQRLQEEQIDLAFIDLLLPFGSGLELAKEIRQTQGDDSLQMVLMSGVFTDPSILQEGSEVIKAKGFLKKPFQIDEIDRILSTLNEKETTLESNVLGYTFLYTYSARNRVSIRSKRRIIAGIDFIESQDLPFILSMLVETKSSGHLNLVNHQGEISGVSFVNGNIISVDVKDEKSYFGNLIILNGFAESSDVEMALQATGGKKIAEKLIELNLLSPHVLPIILKQQMHLRLSKLIDNETLKFNFVPDNHLRLKHPFISEVDFFSYLYDWIFTKSNDQWLIAHYSTWINAEIKITDVKRSLPAILEKEDAHQKIWHYFCNEKVPTLNGATQIKGILEITLYRLTHYLICANFISFLEKQSSENREARLKRFVKLSESLEKKNLIEVLAHFGGHAQMNDADLNKAHSRAIEQIEPKPLETDLELLALYQKMEKKIEAAFSLAQDRDALTSYQNSLIEQNVTERIKREAQLEEARKLLGKGLFKGAKNLLDQLKAKGTQMEGLNLINAWCELAMLKVAVNPGVIIQDTEKTLQNLTPEEKLTPLAFFVMGLLFKAKKENEMARAHFTKALSLDPHFAESKRELIALEAQRASGNKVQNTGILNRDLKDIVGLLFKKK